MARLLGLVALAVAASAVGLSTPVAMSAHRCTPPAAAKTPAYGGSIRVDVDGDGFPDQVHVVVDPNAPAACAFVLRAETRHGPVSGRIWWPVDKYRGESARELQNQGPVIDGAAHVDLRRGAEIVVDLGHKATSVLWTLFAVRDRRFVQLRIENGPVTDHNIFGIGGSVCCGSTDADCVGGKRSSRIVVESFSEVERSRTRFDIRFYRLVGVVFQRVRILRGSYSGNRVPPSIPAIQGSFASC